MGVFLTCDTEFINQSTWPRAQTRVDLGENIFLIWLASLYFEFKCMDHIGKSKLSTKSSLSETSRPSPLSPSVAMTCYRYAANLDGDENQIQGHSQHFLSHSTMSGGDRFKYCLT